MAQIVNVHQSEAWNGYEGQHWADHHDRYDAVNNGYNESLLDAAAIGPRDRVLDIGCGNGRVTRLAARRARLGTVTGVDLSGPMLARARDLAAQEDIPNVTFEQGDAQVYPFADGSFDAAISRFGVMFFADPVAAFANIRRALREGGRLAFLPMAPLGATDLGTVLATLPPRDEPAIGTHEQGPLSLSDPARVREVLEGAGFADVSCAGVEVEQIWGRDAPDAARFVADWGPIRYNYGGSDEIVDTLTRAMRPFERDGAVRLRGSNWLVSARR
ncbi:class I SAM-dependent methyltransferase [Actinomadura meridiana]|uniref:Class I SAM-dependent methyltransferase n=1 Tax=Actinomadura meridiana TaxID=559626 RepID=A0ABP8C6N3_9ACTN